MVSLGVGIGLRLPHYRAFLERRPDVGWIEVHAENYLARSGWDWHVLSTVRRDYPVSLHGVGLGLGSVHGFSEDHLRRVRALADAIEPALVSEHLSWGALPDRQLNDLLPLRLDEDALARVAGRVARVQDVLGRRLLVENLSAYLRFGGDALGETEFLAELVRRTGCGVLLDVNNLVVNQCNHGEDPYAAMAALPPGSVGEIHLGGHVATPDGVIDHHGARVAPPVWDVYRAALERFGPVSTLVEWDTDLPTLDVLIEEAATAARIGEQVRQRDVAAVAVPSSRPASNAQEPSAATLQQLFGAALFDAGQAPALAPWINGDPRRLAIYRANLGASWARALANAYPVTRQLVGEDAFEGLARAYGRAHPSRDPDLNRFGRHLPAFLDRHAPDAGHPWLPDVARLEWAVHEAYCAPDAHADLPPLDSLDPAAFEASPVQLAPALRLHASPWATAAIWRAHREQEAAWPECLDAPTHALVSRKRWRVEVEVIGAAEHAALAQLAAGGTVGEALDAACGIDGGFDVASRVRRWLTDGMIVGMPPA